MPVPRGLPSVATDEGSGLAGTFRWSTEKLFERDARFIAALRPPPSPQPSPRRGEGAGSQPPVRPMGQVTPVPPSPQ